MEQYTVTFLPSNATVTVDAGTTILQAQIQAGLHPDAPCGGNGTCGKCRVELDGREVLACQTVVDRDMTVKLTASGKTRILTNGLEVDTEPDGANRYALAFDIGTTTVVCYLLDGLSGALIAQASTVNPQSQFGADVISRIQTALETGTEDLKICIRAALAKLTREAARKAGITPGDIGVASIVGNTAMHHLMLGIDPSPMVVPPYMPGVFEALELDAEGILPISGKVRILPNIAGFVGGDTVGCMASTRFDTLEELTLMIDIGTNGEMVLGDRNRRIACSTAAGPAFEGARISCGMRGADGAVDHVTLKDGTVHHHVIGEGRGIGLCGSGLLDLVAVLLDLEIVDESGYLEGKTYHLEGTEVTLTQKDVREVQLAKAAIRAGIELLAETLGVETGDIQKVYLAGAFGNYLDPASACRIGMIPPVLLARIQPIGNAAGEGSKLSALSAKEFDYAKTLAANTEFLELASLPNFNDCYVDALEFAEEDETMTYEQLRNIAEKSGFTAWAPLDVATIELKPEVRDMCAVNACGRYGKCWSCPPGCGTLEECGDRIKGHTHGILVQTIGNIEDSFDFEAMMEIEAEHKVHFKDMHKAILETGTPVLAIGTGSCTSCKTCTYPDAPCRFPEKLVASMEAYGMVVNEICKANGLAYNYGPEKMAYTCCFLL